MEKFFVNWVSYKNNEEIKIGTLINEKGWYFQYSDRIIEAINNGFTLFFEMPYIETVYYSDTLFKTFSNRLSPNININNIKDLIEEDFELITDKVKIKHIKGDSND